MADIYFDGKKVAEGTVQCCFSPMLDLCMLQSLLEEITELYDKENIEDEDIQCMVCAVDGVINRCISLRNGYKSKYEKIKENKELEQYL